MHEAGFNFDIIVPDGIDEIYPDNLMNEEIPVYLADIKAAWFNGKLNENDIVITADTIVFIDHEILGKPSNSDEASAMLKKLSGRPHDVITGVCFLSSIKKKTFFSKSTVYFRELKDEEIEYYVKTYKPYDKAGAYGAQEWIGFIGIECIKGSYFNVMGLPIQQLYLELERFIEDYADRFVYF
jgi:septum formation protein